MAQMDNLEDYGYTVIDSSFDKRSPGNTRVVLGETREGTKVVIKMMDKKYLKHAFHEYCLHLYAQRHDPEGQYIGKLLDFLIIKNTIFIVTLYYDGGTLWDYINSSESASNSSIYNEKWNVIANSCMDCVNFLHSINICHLDIKPLNFVFSNRTRTSVLLIDFGLSQHKNFLPYRFDYGTKYFRPLYNISRIEDIDNFGLGIILSLLYFGEYPFDEKDINRYEDGKQDFLEIKYKGKRDLYDNEVELGGFIDGLMSFACH